MQQSFEGLQTAATAKFGWRMKRTGSGSTPRNDRLLHQPVSLAHIWLISHGYQSTNSIFLSHQTSQQYFQSWLISQTNPNKQSDIDYLWIA